MKRSILNHLKEWKKSVNRKVLLVRGARQVGKTYIIRQLSKDFKYYIEVNFELDPEIKDFFAGSLNPDSICTKLSAYYGVPVINGKTLVFFDEIQACPEALQSLRFFYEIRPDLHVIAAGSLLEFALKNISSYGVGRIRSLFMYPMTFNEFLSAEGKENLIEIKQQASPQNPPDDVFHKQLIEYLIRFIIVGGMPEAVKTFVNTKDIILTQTVLNDIITSLEDDFAKYKERINTSRLKDIYSSIMHQSGNKYIVSKSSETGNHEQKKEALGMLNMANLCYLVYHSSANGLPLPAEKNYKKFKVLFFDTGLFQRFLNMNIADFITAKSMNQINKGAIAEQYVGIEFIKNLFLQNKPDVFYWMREKKGGSAEIDYLFQGEKSILPVEVKSGKQGKMQSLFIFLKQKQLNKGIRVSMENFSSYKNIDVFPLYAIDNIISYYKIS